MLSPKPFLGLPRLGQPVLKSIGRPLAEAIIEAIEFLETSPPSGDFWYAEKCYQNIQERWHETQAIKSKMKTILEEGGNPALTPDELALAADAVECADVIQERVAKKQGDTIETVVAIGGIATTVLGLAVFLG